MAEKPSPSLPANVHVSTHPCLQAKLSQLRSQQTKAKEVKALVHEIALIVGCEALAKVIAPVPGPKVGYVRRDSGGRDEGLAGLLAAGCLI